MIDNAILIEKEVVPCALMEWAKWYAINDRTVAKTQMGVALVSTVFIGLNHRYGDGPPLWFETLVFGGKLDQEMDRYETYAEAERGHEVMVSRVEQAEMNEAQP